MDTLADFYPAAKMWVSGILPRLDDDNDRAKEINELVKTHCQKLPDEAVQYIDFSIDFINKDRSIKKKLFRFSEGHEEDAVHLGNNTLKPAVNLFLLEPKLIIKQYILVQNFTKSFFTYFDKKFIF
jgi:hypothetical protein